MKKSIFVLVLAIFAIFGARETATAQQRTGVYINQQEISAQDLMVLQQFIGPLYPGSYYVDAYGNFGVVGYQPSFNLYQVVQAVQAQWQQQQQSGYGNSYNSNGQSNYYYNDPNSSGYYFREGNVSGYGNHVTRNGVTTDGTLEGTIIRVDGEVLSLPPY